MDRVQFRARVYPPPDVPLVNGSPPDVPDDTPDTPARTVRLGYVLAILAWWLAISYILGTLAEWREPATPLLTGAWTAACGLATLVAIRRSQ